MTKKISVSPIIYNNGDRNITLKIDIREVLKMIDTDGFIDKELNDVILSDDEAIIFFLIIMLQSIKDDEEQLDFYLSDYETSKAIIQANRNSIKDHLNEILKDVLNNDFVLDTIKQYETLLNNEAKSVIYALSRLLYMQDKHKADQIGQDLDKVIKEWIKYIQTVDYSNLKEKLSNPTTDEEMKETVRQYNAYALQDITRQIIKNIYANNKLSDEFFKMTLLNPQNNKKDTIGYFKTYLTNVISNAESFRRYSEKLITNFINSTIDKIQLDNFQNAYEEQLKEIKAKVEKEKTGNTKLSVKNSLLMYELYKDKLVSEDFIQYVKDDDFINGAYELYQEYQKTDEYKQLEQTKQDILIWREKATNFINHIEGLTKEPTKKQLSLDYILEHLAYSDYQKKAYKIGVTYKDTDPTQKVEYVVEEQPKRKLSRQELKEKYKDATLLNGEQLDYNRKFARVDTSKVNTNIMDLRESITKKVQPNTNRTQKKINELEKKPKPSKEDLAKLKDLKEQLKEQQDEQQAIINEVNDLKADIELLDKQISDTQDATQIKKLTRKRNAIQKQINEKEEILRNEDIYLQADLFSNGKLVVAEKVNKKTKESYKLMINGDYDIQNFNSEGRNFLYYIPNIPNIIEELNEDFITLDLDDYLDFTGRPNTNVSRVRRNLQSTLKEMRKESYDYTYLDEKGILHDDSLILIGDIKGTEYKGKATVKVQLGATFKDNLKQAFVKSHYVKVNRDVFKIGQGRNNKVENMAKEIFLYLAKLCRNEAKKQVNSGKWQKDVHLDTIITKLCELNLINYNPNRYNETVKEPLLYALNTGVELGYFTYKTDAFRYYDDVIASSNKGASVQDKITNFEKGKEYGIKFTINGDMVDLENNQKAHKTYEENKRKYDRKATKN